MCYRIVLVFEERRGSLHGESSNHRAQSPGCLSVQELQLDPEEVEPCLGNVKTSEDTVDPPVDHEV
jgi:hypothetical protein